MAKAIKDRDIGLSWVEKLSIKGLKKEAAQRGCDFETISSLSVLQLQAWVIKNAHKPIDLNQLKEYDDFLRNHDDLAFGILGFKMNVENEPKREILEYKEHDPDYKPRAGTRKELTQELVRQGLPTSEIILEVYKAFGRTNPQSIKSWASRFRKQLLNSK